MLTGEGDIYNSDFLMKGLNKNVGKLLDDIKVHFKIQDDAGLANFLGTTKDEIYFWREKNIYDYTLVLEFLASRGFGNQFLNRITYKSLQSNYAPGNNNFFTVNENQHTFNHDVDEFTQLALKAIRDEQMTQEEIVAAVREVRRRRKQPVSTLPTSDKALSELNKNADK